MKLELPEAIDRVLDNVEPIERTKVISIEDSLGQVTGKAVVSRKNIPEHDIAIRDGYALRSIDLIENVQFKLVEGMKLRERECKRVDTGESMPGNADFLIMVENVRRTDEGIILKDRLTNHRNIIKKGSNIKKGEEILRHGTLINEVNIGIFPTIEKETVEVYEKSKVGIIATGDEISQVNDVNSRILNGIVDKNGGEVKSIRRINDVKDRIRKTILELTDSGLDVVLTIGGTSKGRKDYLKQVIPKIGEILIDRVKIRPGGTFTFGKVGGTPIFSFSGFGTPCMIQSHLFLVPALRRMNHLPERKLRQFSANKTIPATSHRVMEKGSHKVLPARQVAKRKIEPVFGKYTTILPFIYANWLMIIDKDKDSVEKGEKIEAISLEESYFSFLI